MQTHEYLAGGTSDTEMQGILGSLVQGRCKVSNLPAKVTQLDVINLIANIHRGVTKETMNFCAHNIYYISWLYKQKVTYFVCTIVLYYILMLKLAQKCNFLKRSKDNSTGQICDTFFFLMMK